ncbi:MAG: GDP-mannose 4,6-dehydratase [Candidatus Marinimicrobia bacterium]|nr:GDP-mannose 4,6-dehydratase [Candidatus Neomarinimicrobiota bacterium]
MSRFAVIGSNSFSGSHFVHHCLKMGHEVIGISRSDELSTVFLPYKWDKPGNFTFYKLDLNTDLHQIMSVVDLFKPQYVVNFAAQSMVGESWTHPEHWFMTNTVSTIKFHDKLRQCDYLEKYIHISTPEVYGNCTGFISENSNYHSSTPYAISRAAADMSLLAFFNSYNFPVVMTRAANVFGPGQQLYRIIPRSILYFLTNKKLQLHGGGQSVRSFIHIKDVCVGTLSAAFNGKPGDIFHLSTDETISILDLVKLIAQKLGTSFEASVDIVEDRKGKDNAYLLDCTKAKHDLNWKSSINISSGIDDTISWVKSNLHSLKSENQNYVHKP